MANGDIGIVSNVPRMQFYENDGAGDTGKWSLVANAGLFRFTTTNDAENFDVSRLAIDRSGNMGVGTTLPTAKLHVAGDLKVSGNFIGTINSTGTLALPNTTNSTTGVLTLGGNPFLHNFGTNSTFLGTSAGNFAMTGVANTGLGAFALATSITGAANTAVGRGALGANISANNNTALGYAALDANTTGYSNTALGSNALTANVGGYWNNATGNLALQVNTEGSSNVATGYGALGYNTTGNINTAVGHLAGITFNPVNGNTTGSYNTFIGAYSGPGTSTQLTNATAIGANAVVSASDALVLGSSGVKVGIGTNAPTDKLQVLGDIRVGTSGTNGCLKNFSGGTITGTCSSDARLKKDIQPFAPVLDKLVRSRPVSFRWRAEEYPEFHFGDAKNSGLIAQEVEKVFPEMVSEDQHGFKQVNYSELPLLAIQAIRELKAQNDQLCEELENLRLAVQSLQQRLGLEVSLKR
ncbi:MAG: tail fiber domain-containing protein [Acidobacteria bacterium]|nr:tail fiber domain-containing protein [Acidobacteriota bacterium]